MLTPLSRSQFVTKILTSPTGEQFRVVFLVALVNGEVKAQVVSAIPLNKNEAATSLCLPCVKNSENFGVFTATPKATLTPFYNELFFFNSQPTRAPSF